MKSSSKVFFPWERRRGVWGAIQDRFNIQLLPVGYRLRGLGRE